MGLSHTHRASIVLRGMTCTGAIMLPACTDQIHPFLPRFFVERQEALAEDCREEMKHGRRTCLEIVPEHLGEIERKLESCMVTRCQEDCREC